MYSFHVLNLLLGLFIAIGCGADLRAAPPASVPSTLTFIENQGQWESSTRFFVRGGEMLARLDQNGIALLLREPTGAPRRSAGKYESHVVRMTFENPSERATVVGEEEQLCRHNFYVGADASKWRVDVPAYARAVYRDLYEGIDLQFRDSAGAPSYGLAGHLEYDVLVRPGADLSQVVIRCEGIEKLSIAEDGALVMDTALLPVRQAPPKTWQVDSYGARQPIECRYRIIDATRYGFETSEWDSSLALFIDPVIEWGAFVGGAGEDYGWSVEVAGDDSLIVVGKTTSPGVFAADGDCDPFDTEHNGSRDAFVARLDAAGELLHWTFLGGSADEEAIAVALGQDGSINLSGYTRSGDFPVTNDSSHGGDFDAFVARLDPTACELVFATYLGGGSDDVANSIAVEATDAIVVAGYTGSQRFPTTVNAFQPQYGGGRYDAFVSRFRVDAGGTSSEQLAYSTFLGGTGSENLDAANTPANNLFIKLYTGGLVTEGDGVVTLVGSTSSFDFPLTDSAFDRTLDGSDDAYVVRLDLDENDNQLLYSTYLGESGIDHATAVALDPVGGLWVTGETVGGFPTTLGAFQRANHGRNDTFLAHVDPTLEPRAQLVYSTLLGGSRNDPPGKGLVVSPSGFVVVGGLVQSSDFPLTEDGAPFHGGNADAFLSVVDPHGGLFYSTHIGGSGWDEINDVALTPSGEVVVIGDTWSAMFDSLPEANSHGAEDAFVLTLDILLVISPPATFLRGNTNGDSAVDIADAVHALNWLFGGGTKPPCLAAANINGDEATDGDATTTINIADPIYLLSFLFGGGSPPVAPYPDCGPATLEADELLGCETPPEACR